MRLMIGSARMIRPMADGIVSNSTSRIECASAPRNSSDVTERGTARNEWQRHGCDRHAKNPSGNCIRRNAMFSQVMGPSPNDEAKPLFTATFTWTALAAIVAGPISSENVAHAGIAPLEVGSETKTDAHERRQLHEQLQQPPTRVPSARPIRRATAEMRIEPGSQSAAPPMIEPRLKKLDAIAGMPKTSFAFNIPMTQRGERDEQNERKHDPREQNRELRLFGREPGRQHCESAPARK